MKTIMKRIIFIGATLAVSVVFSSHAFAKVNTCFTTEKGACGTADWTVMLNDPSVTSSNKKVITNYVVGQEVSSTPDKFKLKNGSGTFSIGGLEVTVNLYCNDDCSGHQKNIQNFAKTYASAQFVGAGIVEPVPDCTNSFYLITVNCPTGKSLDPTTNTCTISCPDGQHFVSSSGGNKWVVWGANGHLYLAPYPVPSYTYSGLTFYVYDPVRQIKGVKITDFEANSANYINNATVVPVGAQSGGRFVFNLALLASKDSTTQVRVINNLKSVIGSPYLCASSAVGAKPCHTNNDGKLTPAFSYTSSGQIYGAYTDSDGSVGYTKTNTVGVFSDSSDTGSCVPDDASLCPDGSPMPSDGNCPQIACIVGGSCTSDANICNDTNSGTYTSCDADGNGICSAVTPADPAGGICPDSGVTPCGSDTDCVNGKTCQGGSCAFLGTPPVDTTHYSNGGLIGSTTITNLRVVSNTINPYDPNNPSNPLAGKCNLVWTINQYDDNSVCTITGGNNVNNQTLTKSNFDKATVISTGVVGTTIDEHISNETTYKITCGEKTADGIVSTSTRYATCYMNASYKETNK